jgi:hypothetical protein
MSTGGFAVSLVSAGFGFSATFGFSAAFLAGAAGFACAVGVAAGFASPAAFGWAWGGGCDAEETAWGGGAGDVSTAMPNNRQRPWTGWKMRSKSTRSGLVGKKPVQPQSQPTAQQPAVQQAQLQPSPAQAQPQQSQSQTPQAQQPVAADLGPRLPMPSDDVLLILIDSSVLALNHANATGDYSVLREMAAPAFQQMNSAAHLAQIFASLRSRTLDLAPILLFQPKLFRRPEMIRKECALDSKVSIQGRILPK